MGWASIPESQKGYGSVKLLTRVEGPQNVDESLANAVGECATPLPTKLETKSNLLNLISVLLWQLGEQQVCAAAD